MEGSPVSAANTNYRPGLVPRTRREARRRGFSFVCGHRPWESIRRCRFRKSAKDAPCLAVLGGGFKRCRKHNPDMHRSAKRSRLKILRDLFRRIG